MYNFIHLGLIQVTAKPNYRIGINNPILIMLRDIILKKIEWFGNCDIIK